MAEKLILVDSGDRQVGVGEKLKTHLDGSLHRAFSIFVFDGAGRLLLQKRAQTKYHSGGLWSNTACGHPRPGEKTLAAAHRRLLEEMGFDCELREAFKFLYRAELDNQLVEHEYDHVFVGRYVGDLSPNPSEVDDWRWSDTKELRCELRRSPKDYTYWLKIVMSSPDWEMVDEELTAGRHDFQYFQSDSMSHRDNQFTD
ncbi:MAG: isopentenyl-diphosphate Delta-isomerase [Pyrinomonadaceae bacterium]|nr:isopentenyl-diphosphate Delta-isomerase [Pyrinomonadaceae bacterium]